MSENPTAPSAPPSEMEPPQPFPRQRNVPNQPGAPPQPYPRQFGGEGVPPQPYPGQQPPYAPPMPYQSMYPMLPQPDFKDPGLNYIPSYPPHPFEPPPPYDMGGQVAPARPAPPPPLPNTDIAQPLPPKLPISLYYPETPLPDGLKQVFEGCEGVQVFFIQPDQQVLSPQSVMKMTFHSSVSGSKSPQDVVAVIDIKRVWRLKITPESCFVVKSKLGDLAFLDHSTNPSTG